MSSDPLACCFSVCQGPILAFLRPGMWIPGARTPHLYRERWEVDGPASEVMDDILLAVESVEIRERLLVRRVDKESLFIRVLSFTSTCEWLDVVEFKCNTALRERSKGFFC